MSVDAMLILLILAVTIVVFLWGRWRHDVVALAALLACVLTGLVPREGAFGGFGHPAVITVACVLILSRGLQTTGAIDTLAQYVMPRNAGPTWTLAGLVGLGALLSAFMNNVGAMALLMPLAIQVAAKHNLTPGKVLMPLSFGTILGGMTTLIGTPPNLIVSGFRTSTEVGAFGMFDFTPVGLAVATTGILFLILLGRRIVPSRPGSQEDHFDTGTYLTEARVTENSKAVGLTLREAERILEAADAQVVGMLRSGTRISIQNRQWVLRTDDILVIEAEPDSFATVLSSLSLTVDEPQQTSASGVKAGKDRGKDTPEEPDKATYSTEDIVLQELVPLPHARLLGRSTNAVKLRSRYGLSLLAISRRGRRIVKRLCGTPIQAGDVLLMQGLPEALAEFAGDYGCVPLAHRSITIPDKRRATLASLIMVVTIAVAAMGLLPADIAFAIGVLLFILFRVISPRTAYDAVDWSVIVLLGGLIPVAGAMATTGAADWLARGLLDTIARGHPVVALTLVLIVTMTLSDFMNNAATAAVMCPLALSTATYLGVRPDAFLMAVAIGASCAFLTPIGHQNNTLILGPGGFRFGDYWRLGLPMEVIVVVVSIPVLLWVWPL
jgi:di/tricarboxylate transporter